MKSPLTTVFVVVVGLAAISCCHCGSDGLDWELWAYQKINHFLVEKLPNIDMHNEEFVGEELDLNLNVVRGFMEDEEAKVAPDGKLVMAASAIVALADLKGHQLCENHTLDLLKDISGSIGATGDSESVGRIRQIVSLFMRSYKSRCMPASSSPAGKLKLQDKLRKLKFGFK